MSIRLNKAIRELNIGLQTAVDFLEKKSLGEVKGDPNFKLSDEQYTALVEQFKSDKDVKTDAAKIFQKKTKEKKTKETAAEQSAEPKVETTRPQFKPLGKIDLDKLNKKPSEKKAAAPVEKPKPEKKSVAAAVSPKPEPEKKPEKKAEVKKPVETKPEPKPVVAALFALRHQRHVLWHFRFSL